ncbi:hypothetical protein BC941DRAFT_264596 [Chlamydoabsidia padenii]|nr:hypothetical protein BC941DRAFT_264596 [Chlamydoabsidia padenii]
MHHHCGSLRLEKHHNTSSRLIRQANQASSWELDLGQSTATREPPTHHHSYSTTTFHLVLGNGTWYEFECEDQDTVTTWIHHIQFVAAMTTQIPFMKPPISSDLYGWELDLTEQYDRLDSCTISTWEPPTVSDTPQMASRISSSSTTSTTSTCSTTSSSLLTTPLLASYPSNYYSKTTIMNQQKGIQQYLVTLGEELQQHSTFFTSISKIPTIYHTQKALIVTNWHEKNNYLIQQMDKYELYSKALETSLSSNNSQSISLTSLLDIDNPIHSFDLFDEINHSLKYVSLE